ncbi:MAG: protein translocase subunit SecD, partial [candidate division Zixibacteria bacterium]|nr:protein translocase subunit SecD [candidate division Zixibacteria bacterium]
IDQFGVNEPVIQKQGEDRIVVELPGLQDVKRAQELIGKTAQLEFKLVESPENTQLVMKNLDQALAGLTQQTKKEKPAKKTTNEKIVKDLFGAESLQDTSQGQAEDFLDTEYAERPLSSLLEQNPHDPSFLVASEDVPKINMYLSKPEIQKIIPEDVEFAWATKSEPIRGMEYQKLYLLKKRVEFSGNYLVDARPSYDEYRNPEVLFTWNSQGARKFAQLTGANIGKPLAIALDGRVESAPIIQSRIRDRGRITMGSGSTYEEAKDLAVVLRVGALPAPVKIIENRVIGPTLGEDSIRKGVISAAIGLGAVLLFLMVYYRLSGVIADLALLFNMFFLLACMAAFHATLTLPGIAGIILTIGMSDDANVLIFERIREELRTGKTIRASIDAGYARAIFAIVDSHVTTLITALVLFKFGTGPIKGFAVSLSLGVAINLFTSVIVTKIIFDVRKGYRSLSI